MVGAREPRSLSRHQQIVANNGLALHLKDIVVAPVADVLLDDVDALAASAVGEDAGVIRVVDVIAKNPVVV